MLPLLYSTAWFCTFPPAGSCSRLPVLGAVVGDAGCSGGVGSAGTRLAGVVGAPCSGLRVGTVRSGLFSVESGLNSSLARGG